jgi:hypothetical protein
MAVAWACQAAKSFSRESKVRTPRHLPCTHFVICADVKPKLLRRMCGVELCSTNFAISIVNAQGQQMVQRPTIDTLIILAAQLHESGRGTRWVRVIWNARNAEEEIKLLMIRYIDK